MDQATHSKIVSFIWGIADDVLRDLFKRGKYLDVILPMCVIRRMDAVLEPTKPKVLDTKKMLDEARITNHENTFVLGPTGVGKSSVACALAQKAGRDGCSALYTRATALFRDLAIARADGSLRSLLTRLSRIDVLGDRRLGHGSDERSRAP